MRAASTPLDEGGVKAGPHDPSVVPERPDRPLLAGDPASCTALGGRLARHAARLRTVYPEVVAALGELGAALTDHGVELAALQQRERVLRERLARSDLHLVAGVVRAPLGTSTVESAYQQINVAPSLQAEVDLLLAARTQLQLRLATVAEGVTETARAVSLRP